MSLKKTIRKRSSPVTSVKLPQQQQSAESLLHELQVYQIELKMQNEALRDAQAVLEETRDRYVDLYEFAPIGYISLSMEGLIQDINLTGAKLLNRERQRLLDRRFSQFVTTTDQAAWHTLFPPGLDQWRRPHWRSRTQTQRFRAAHGFAQKRDDQGRHRG